jgi:hypothetical protein
MTHNVDDSTMEYVWESEDFNVDDLEKGSKLIEQAHRAVEKEERLRKHTKRDQKSRAADTQEQRGEATEKTVC